MYARISSFWVAALHQLVQIHWHVGPIIRLSEEWLAKMVWINT
jgi:hypothetical protein